jgi:hypothetical protein
MTYAWLFQVLSCYVEAEGKSNVVYGIQFMLRGDDGGITGCVVGAVDLTYQAGDPFIEFADLQASDVEGWVATKLGPDKVAMMKANIDAQIAEQITPTKESYTTMPWADGG